MTGKKYTEAEVLSWIKDCDKNSGMSGIEFMAVLHRYLREKTRDLMIDETIKAGKVPMNERKPT